MFDNLLKLEQLEEETHIQSLTPTELKELKKLSVSYRCQSCGRQYEASQLELHHRFPQQKKLTKKLHNHDLIVLCSNCHSLQHSNFDHPGPKLNSPEDHLSPQIDKLRRSITSQMKSGHKQTQLLQILSKFEKTLRGN